VLLTVIISFSIETCETTIASMDISAIYCWVLLPIYVENGISDICCFRGVILSLYSCS